MSSRWPLSLDMSDSESSSGSESSRGKSPQDKLVREPSPSPDPRDTFRRFFQLEGNDISHQEWVEHESTRLAAMWREKNGPSIETVMTEFLFEETGRYKALFGALFHSLPNELAMITACANEGDWDPIRAWFDKNLGMYDALQNVMTERQDSVLHQHHRSKAVDRCKQLEDKLEVTQRENKSLKDLVNSMARQHRDWWGVRTKMNTALDEMQNSLTEEERKMILQISPPLTNPSPTQAARTLTQVHDLLTSQKRKRDDHSDAGGSSRRGRGVASRRGRGSRAGRGGRGEGGHNGD